MRISDCAHSNLHTNLKCGPVLREAQAAGELVAAAVAGDPVHEEMQLLQAMREAKL